MEYLDQAINFVQTPTGVMILGGLLTISEGLALTPRLQANGILQAVIQILSRFAPKKD
jgi:hypothetical protein